MTDLEEVKEPNLADTLQKFMDFTTSQMNNLSSQQAEMQKSIAGMTTKPVQVAPSFDKDAFFSDPDRVISAKLDHAMGNLKQDLAAQLVPINAIAQQFAVQGRVGQYINYLKSNPSTADAGQFEDILTNLIQQYRGEVDTNALYGIYLTAKGLFYSRPKAAVTPTGTGNIPPYISPNSPVIPTTTIATTPLRELSELERRISTQQGMTPADFLYYGGEITKEVWEAHTKKA